MDMIHLKQVCLFSSANKEGAHSRNDPKLQNLENDGRSGTSTWQTSQKLDRSIYFQSPKTIRKHISQPATNRHYQLGQQVN